MVNHHRLLMGISPLGSTSRNDFSLLHAVHVKNSLQASRPSSTLVLLVEFHEKRKSLPDERYGQ
jgi:hypothetical protein